ncbi:hypothetical protein LshimejAT787_2000960 [Lyophyllum shimeji]|uniref:Uncharacterized protein n=1 Tax=Lyophyllum shimeji TaxID=47721 RepID=A0A9P3UWK3_LYOSH|nr:hypothetical protein LshimejAT787_2000960 [Lyophyllum shimeji]
MRFLPNFRIILSSSKAAPSQAPGGFIPLQTLKLGEETATALLKVYDLKIRPWSVSCGVLRGDDSLRNGPGSPVHRTCPKVSTDIHSTDRRCPPMSSALRAQILNALGEAGSCSSRVAIGRPNTPLLDANAVVPVTRVSGESLPWSANGMLELRCGLGPNKDCSQNTDRAP